MKMLGNTNTNENVVKYKYIHRKICPLPDTHQGTIAAHSCFGCKYEHDFRYRFKYKCTKTQIQIHSPKKIPRAKHLPRYKYNTIQM